MTMTTLRAAAAMLLISTAAMIAGCQDRTGPTVPPATPTAGDPTVEVETSSADQAQVDALVQPYLDLRQLLADDQMQGVPEAFAAIRVEAQQLSDSEDARVQSLARTLAKGANAEPQDLEQARKAFTDVSTAMIDLVKAVPPTGAAAETLYVAYCPMVKASWLQKTEEVANPYMGQKMLACGEVTETIGPK